MASKGKKSGNASTGRAAADVTSAVGMLEEDHRKVQQLFDEFERTEESAAKRRLVEKAIIELTIHSKLEEELFYPAARRKIGDEELMDEAAEEHHVVALLIGELASMKPSDPRYEAKFLVLAENVRHHIEEEEAEILPKVERAGLDLESLGQEMGERKMTLAEEVSVDTIRGEAWPVPGETPRRASGGRRSRSRRVGGRARAKARA